VPKEYDVNNVHLYISDVMKLTDRQKMLLWFSVTFGPLPDVPQAMMGRFSQLTTWEQANVLFRFGPIIDKIVREEAKRFADMARQEDGEAVA
jgi:hypothetical protein